jgi:8-oxo-dGTP pyrophosphatase MutT (NUDIX family)
MFQDKWSLTIHTLIVFYGFSMVNILTKHVAGCIFISPRHRILCVLGRTSQKWSFPKGHLQDGETAFQCARRETFEETGVLPPQGCKKVVLLPTGTYFIFEVNEFQCFPQDTTEVQSTAWLTYRQLCRANVNLDINAFLSRHRTLCVAQRPHTFYTQTKPNPVQCIDVEI